MRIRLLIGLLVTLAILLTSGCQAKKKLQQTQIEVWNVYRGEITGYHVRMDEEMENGVWKRGVNLEPIHGYNEPRPTPFGIRAYDYDGDRQIDELFIREVSRNGYNAVTFTGRGARVWNPCPADRDAKVPPPSDALITFALAQVYLAMATVHNQGHLVSTLEIARVTLKENQ